MFDSLHGGFITFSARETLPCKSNRIGEGISATSLGLVNQYPGLSAPS